MTPPRSEVTEEGESPEAIALGRDALRDYQRVAQYEWLVTNGIGGYASGTVAGVNTRRYHGLLVAALKPPVARTVMVAKLDASARYAGTNYELGTNEYADGTVSPQGYRYLESFRLEGQQPVWTWVIGDAVLEQRLWMAYEKNTTYLRYRLLRGSDTLELELKPFCTYRDYHWQHRGASGMEVRQSSNGIELQAYEGAQMYRIALEQGSLTAVREWYWNFKHREESARGLDDLEDLLVPALLHLRLSPGEHATVVLSAEAVMPPRSEQSLVAERERQLELLGGARRRPASPLRSAPNWIEQLVLAADQFIVTRQGDAMGDAGKSVIAGYPWFSDWGRDTMIALPGLTLVTGRHEIAANVLRTFARFVSEGMLPNRFPDAGEAPEYNTVDATLWFVVAIDEYLRCSADRSLRQDLYPVLKQIVEWHIRGTRFGIRVDESDGLLHSGEPGVQLTWMDAKVGDWVVTPRTGKCVEINALWFNALKIMQDLAQQQADAQAVRQYEGLAGRVLMSFVEKFWYDAGGYLYDVIDSSAETLPDHRDASLRPNQIFAVSLRYPLLQGARARAVVDVCARELWTPLGLRSLAGSDSHYTGVYGGGPRERDGAYHQGTAWSWLLGPFAIAHYRVYGDAKVATSYLQGVAAHLRDACIGQVSEVTDGDAPYRPGGCFAQAWGVAEILRSWSELHER